ncbi:MAG TPA: BRCT domain-containing protein [Tepidisphaeraceae bacterium]|jgi:NAD-dependent DNA ligase|nr:BRCT domain-containing protein [Tepidisphaeraceae bacterium]
MGNGTTKKGAPDWSTLRLLGKTFVVVAKQGYQKRVLAEQIAKEGGRVVDDVTEKTNYIVLHDPRGMPAAVKTAEKPNKKGANIAIIDTADRA